MNKILINGLLVSDESTGIGNYGFNIINSLNKINNDYEITALTQKNIEFTNINNVYKSYQKPYNRIINEQFMLLKEYNKNDILHFIDYSSPIINTKKPFIITIHDLTYYKYPETFNYISRKIKQIISPLSIKRASKIITVSESTKKDILSMFNVNKNKIEVIYNGKPDYERIEEKSEIEKIKHIYNISGEYILYLGTLEPRKNISRLIEAYNELVKIGINEKLVIAGKKGWLYDDIFARVKKLQLDEKVIFTGYINEEHKPYIYSGAKIFIYPSIYEGFGLPPLEAMTCGVPVIVSQSSSLPEVVGDCGLYVNPYDVNSIFEAMNKLLTNERMRLEYSQKGIERSKFFSWDSAAEKIFGIYNDIIYDVRNKESK